MHSFFQEKAKLLSVEMGFDDFSASNGWLHSWQKQFNVSFAALSGEPAAVPQASVGDWIKRLPDIPRDFELKDIINTDETGLFYRALPQHSMVLKGDPRKGILKPASAD